MLSYYSLLNLHFEVASNDHTYKKTHKYQPKNLLAPISAIYSVNLSQKERKTATPWPKISIELIS